MGFFDPSEKDSNSTDEKPFGSSCAGGGNFSDQDKPYEPPTNDQMN